MEETKILKQIIKMIHILPEVQDYFKFYPLRSIYLDDSAFITHKVGEMTLSDFGDSQNLLNLNPPYSMQTMLGEDRTISNAFGAGVSS